VLDFIALAANPIDKSIWAGSYGGGLVHFKDNNIQIYKGSNSTLQPAIGDINSYRISGLAFDANNNLWISNYAAPQNLQVRKQDGSFKAFTIPFTHFENAISQLVVDDANQIWIVKPKRQWYFCYNYGNSIDALNDDQWKYIRSGIGLGNLPSNNVYCLAKDKNGLLWIGTDKRHSSDTMCQ
jgi:ligand-binding sensor domain-containing protein